MNSAEGFVDLDRLENISAASGEAEDIVTTALVDAGVGASFAVFVSIKPF